jgi:hypothetical protein
MVYSLHAYVKSIVFFLRATFINQRIATQYIGQNSPALESLLPEEFGCSSAR